MEELVLRFGLYYIFFSFLLFFLFKKYLLSIFDPFLFTVLMMASSLSLSTDSYFFFYVFFSILAFTIGFRLIKLPVRNDTKIEKLIDLQLLEIFTILFFILYVVLSLYFLKLSGVPLFSDNPTEAKISRFVEGTGWMRRVFFLSNFLLICICLLLIVSKKRFIFFVMFVAYFLLSILQGSKSGALGIVAVFWYFYQQNNIWSDSVIYIKKLIKSKMKYFLIVTAVLFLSIVIKEAQIEEEDGNPIFAIGFRLMEFGDVMIYYKTQIVRDSFANFNFIDYFLYEFNSIFGMLRLTDYYEPMGYQMVKTYWSTSSLFDDVVLGPNTVFFVRGHIFFGYIGGIIYSFLIGILTAYFRKKIIEIRITSVFRYALAVYGFFLIPAFLKEFNQAIGTMFDFVFYLGPIFFLSLIIKESFNKNKIIIE
ncbi:MAG: O-antigen polymerase [Flavobacterium nitrogenifigens]|uniref:Oligosaccharide repeat unit polymerase n=1 Tax=Flavobacterium nitrogenifigens TaxID=1617283 RepID=A0A521EDH9_9FLAO|nr:O-antigen polymerase [Flavobacterium nitrogenifigens]KAF2325919.1 oligosaccharide repeat unit polymerase [Flavobacterium nitrogenifigens]MDQ8013347.1 O-antigen polymerase [Flavobacterium nitrogenifigens]SMO81983.1 oligosaccharide repeat unit polymerase [Flavobacterium nitrogenifigens]